jgi:hypothetical protein
LPGCQTIICPIIFKTTTLKISIFERVEKERGEEEKILRVVTAAEKGPSFFLLQEKVKKVLQTLFRYCH